MKPNALLLFCSLLTACANKVDTHHKNPGTSGDGHRQSRASGNYSSHTTTHVQLEGASGGRHGASNGGGGSFDASNSYQGASGNTATGRDRAGMNASQYGRQSLLVDRRASAGDSDGARGVSGGGARGSASGREQAETKGAQTGAGESKAGANKSLIMGTWSGVSDGEKIILKVGSGGTASLTNSGGATSGDWTSGASAGRYKFDFGGRSGDFVLINATTATLRVMGSTIELKR